MKKIQSYEVNVFRVCVFVLGNKKTEKWKNNKVTYLEKMNHLERPSWNSHPAGHCINTYMLFN